MTSDTSPDLSAPEWKQLTDVYTAEAAVTDWLDEEFETARFIDVSEHPYTDPRPVTWRIPNFAAGRSHALGVDRDVLANFDWRQIAAALKSVNWRALIERDDLLVRRIGDGDLEVTTWTSEPSDKWFWSADHNQWFVILPWYRHWFGGEQPRFVAVHGESYSAVAIEGVPNIADVQFDQIKNSLPQLDEA